MGADTMQEIFIYLTFGGLMVIWWEIKSQGDD